MADVTIPLSPEAQRALAKPVVGRGGHQTLLRKLQRQIQGGMLTASLDDLEKMVRYILSYGRGGFQQRIAAAAGRTPAKRRARKK